jgi:hypothetical protein
MISVSEASPPSGPAFPAFFACDLTPALAGLFCFLPLGFYLPMAKPSKPKKTKQPRVPKPWEIAPRPAKGDDDQNKLFAAVGYALSRWEEFEEEVTIPRQSRGL